MSQEQIDKLFDKYQSMENRVIALETNHQIAAVHNEAVERRLSAIESILQKLTWLIVSTLLVALIGFIVTGGIANG